MRRHRCDAYSPPLCTLDLGGRNIVISSLAPGGGPQGRLYRALLPLSSQEEEGQRTEQGDCEDADDWYDDFDRLVG